LFYAKLLLEQINQYFSTFSEKRLDKQFNKIYILTNHNRTFQEGGDAIPCVFTLYRKDIPISYTIFSFQISCGN